MTFVWSNLVSVPFVFHMRSHFLSGFIRSCDSVWWTWIFTALSDFYPPALRARAAALARALASIPKLQTVYVPRAYFVPENDVVLIKNRSLQRIYCRVYYWVSNFPDFEAGILDFARSFIFPYLGRGHLPPMLQLVTGTSGYFLPALVQLQNWYLLLTLNYRRLSPFSFLIISQVTSLVAVYLLAQRRTAQSWVRLHSCPPLETPDPIPLVFFASPSLSQSIFSNYDVKLIPPTQPRHPQSPPSRLVREDF